MIEQQTEEKSFRSIVDGDDTIVIKVLNKCDATEVNAANDEWLVIRQWVNRRTKALELAANTWEEFKRNEADLLDYLRDNQKELTAWNQLDLNDGDSVNARKKEFNVCFHTF